MSTDKNILLVNKLISLTHKKELSWQVVSPPKILTAQKDELIVSCYQTIYNHNVFYVYTERYKNYSLEFDQFYFDERTMISAIQYELIVWEYWENQNLTKDLLNTISQQIFNIDSFLQSYTCNFIKRKIVKDKFDLHPALKGSLNQLYGYASDGDGILLEESNLTYIDAKFMLVACTNFINYLIDKTKDQN